jgi:hypothetical protein
MAKDALTGSPYAQPACPVPDAGGGTTLAHRGGEGLTDMPPETPNMSELGLLPSRVDVKDGPAEWSHADVEPGVASPAVAVTAIDRS